MNGLHFRLGGGPRRAAGRIHEQPRSTSGRGRTRRVLSLTAIALTLLGGVPAIASAGTDTIVNGVATVARGPFRASLNRVYVHDLSGAGGGGGACEDAINYPDGYAQDYPYCVSNGDIWHDFCGCNTRKGEVATFRWYYYTDNSSTETMNGHQNY